MMTDGRIAIGVRILAVAGGLFLAYGLSIVVLGFAAWIGPPKFLGTPLLISLAVLAGTALLLRRSLKPGPWRTTALLATTVCMIMLVLQALGEEVASPKRISTQMMSALYSLSVSQEAFKRESGSYSAAAPAEFTEMTGGMIHEIKLADGGWTATLISPVYKRTCAMFVGTTPVPPAVVSGEAVCRRHPFRATDHPLGLMALAVGAIIGMIAHGVHSRQA